MRLTSIVLAGVLLAAPPLAYGQVPRQVMDALHAQVAGPGGCLEPTDSITHRVSPFFPDVAFYVLTCHLEHGGTALRIAGHDGDGVTYVLDSESGFRFLTQRHSPVGLDSLSAVAFAVEALGMMGEVPLDARVVELPAHLPAAVCARLGDVCAGLFRTRVTDPVAPNGVIILNLTTYSPSTGAVYSAGPVGVAPNGHVIAVVETLR